MDNKCSTFDTSKTYSKDTTCSLRVTTNNIPPFVELKGLINTKEIMVTAVLIMI